MDQSRISIPEYLIKRFDPGKFYLEMNTATPKLLPALRTEPALCYLLLSTVIWRDPLLTLRDLHSLCSADKLRTKSGTRYLTILEIIMHTNLSHVFAGALRFGLLALVLGSSTTSLAQIQPPPPPPPLTPQPIQLPLPQPPHFNNPASFPLPAAVIDGWAQKNDQASIRAHAWALWSGITAITPKTQGWPVYETWYTDLEVEAGRPCPGGVCSAAHTKAAATRAAGYATHRFGPLRQLHHGRPAATGRTAAGTTTSAPDAGLQVLGFNKFNEDYANFVWTNGYNTAATLWSVQNKWPVGTLPTQRAINPFPNRAIGLKPVYMIVAGVNNNNGVTVMPYWLGDLSSGPANSSNPGNPTVNTWKQCVVVYSGTKPGGIAGDYLCPPNANPNVKATASGFVSLNAFYHFQLNTQDDINAINADNQFQATNAQIGDYAVLVAIHMTTRENSNWTWQTFWWNYGQPFPYGSPPKSINAPFNNYAMCTAYSMTVNPANSLKGKNTLCYNPYLETGLPQVAGVASDCMSCHRTASYGNNPNNPPGATQQTVGLTPNYPSFLNMSNYISPSNKADAYYYFYCNTTTDFSWFLAGNVAGNSSAPGVPGTDGIQANTPCAGPW